MKLSNSYLLLESNLFHLGEGGEPILREFFYCYIHMSTQEYCHSLVRYPPLQKIIRETKLSYLGGLLLGSVIKSLRVVDARAGGAAQSAGREQADCLWWRTSKGAGNQWQLEARDKSAVLS